MGVDHNPLDNCPGSPHAAADDFTAGCLRVMEGKRSTVSRGNTTYAIVWYDEEGKLKVSKGHPTPVTAVLEIPPDTRFSVVVSEQPPYRVLGERSSIESLFRDMGTFSTFYKWCIIPLLNKAQD